MSVHVAAQHPVHPGLIPGAPGLEPVDDFAIEPDGQLLLRRGKTDNYLTPIKHSLISFVNRRHEFFFCERIQVGIVCLVLAFRAHFS